MPRRIAIVINLNWTLKHHQEVFGGTQTYAREQNWESVLWPFAPKVTSKGKKLFDGIIARATAQLAAEAAAANIPLVNVWTSSPVWSTVPSVVPDVAAAAKMVASHLYGRGFRNFGYVGFTRVEASRKLEDGFRASLPAGGKRVFNRLLVSSSYGDSSKSWSRFQEDLNNWIRKIQTPIGILAVNDKVGRYVANAADEVGLRVPEDVAIVGMENEEIICLNPDPSLTSVELDYRRVGEQAAALLSELMDGADPPAKPILVPPVALVPRTSSDAFDVKDPFVAKALRFIADECHRPIKVRDVVAHVPVSQRSLERLFQSFRGCTIANEMTRFRIERAKRLLADTDMLVKQVAESCGFTNTRRLCDVFQRVEKTSPARFRRQHLNIDS